MNHSFQQLRHRVRKTSTRPFRARGSIVKRCLSCLMADFACFCAWKNPSDTQLEFILLVHRNEVFKPTNSGRLVSDLFPHKTYVFLWSRTEPDSFLLELLADPAYRTDVLFPDQPTAQAVSAKAQVEDDRPRRIVLLDGTWKQASKMAHQSAWLQAYPRRGLQQTTIPFCVNDEEVNDEENLTTQYIRKAPCDYQLSTAQAAVCLLYEHGEIEQSQALADYFSIFNQHCIATRRNLAPEISPAHVRLRP